MPKFSSCRRLNGHFTKIRSNYQLAQRTVTKTVPCCTNASQPSNQNNQNNNNHDAGVCLRDQ